MSNETETVVTAGKMSGLAKTLDNRFHFTERGSTLKTEIGAGCIAFFIAVCALVMNAQIIHGAYGNVAGPYFAATLLCFVGSLLLGLVCNLPLVQTANMALSAAVISMLSTESGITYWNLMAITFVAAVAYLAVVLTPAKRFFLDAIPAGVRKALPVGLGIYTIGMGLRNAGLVADGMLTDAGSLMTLDRFYFWIMVGATVLYIVLRALKRNNALLKTFGLMVGVMWVFGVIFYMNQFIGGQTAATVVYHRVNLVVATDGASPYNIGAGFAGLQLGKVFTEGFNFSAYSGSAFWLFVQGILSFLFLGLYTNAGNTDAAAIAGGYETDPAAEGKVYVIGAALNAVAPILGVPSSSVGIQSAAGTKDGGRTGLTSVVASAGFLIAAFTWLFIMFFATGTNGAGMWINETETKLAVYVNDTFAFADLVMVFVGASLLAGAARIDWKNAKEFVPFIITAACAGFIGNLALAVALGVIAYAVFHFASAERKENAKTVAALGVIMLIFTILACVGTGGAAKASTASAATTSGGTLDNVTDFAFDFDTGAYSFTGANNAQFYVVRVYSVENGVESVSALAQSDRIDADDSNTYAGTIDASLIAGDYNAYVLAVASGYSPSTTQVSGASTMLATPNVSAVWDGEEPDLAVKLTIRAGDAVAQSYTVSVAKDGTEVYAASNIPAGELFLTAADLGVEALSKDDAYTVTVSVDPVPGYTAPESVTVNVTEQMGWGSGEPSGGPGGGSGESAANTSGEAQPASDASGEPAADASEGPASEASADTSAEPSSEEASSGEASQQ